MDTSDKKQPVLLFQYNQLVKGKLLRRYKRFLADMQFQDDSTSSASSNSSMQAACGHTFQAGAGAATVAAAASPAAASEAAACQVSSGACHRHRARGTATNHGKTATAASAKAATAAIGVAVDAAGGPVKAAVIIAATAGVSVVAADATATATVAVTSLSADIPTTVVHCPNTGSMLGLLDSLPAAAACSISTAATRKYKHTLEIVQVDSPLGPTWVGVHSALANIMAAALLDKQLLMPQLGPYNNVQPEVKLGGSSNSRVDFMLSRTDGKQVYIEVKSITMAMPHSQWKSIDSSSSAKSAQPKHGRKRRPAAAHNSANVPSATGLVMQDIAATPAAGAAVAVATAVTAAVAHAAETGVDTAAAGSHQLIALFPDAVSERARRHVKDLIQLVAAGHEAVCLFVIQRGDCSWFAPAAHIDPAYASAVKAAKTAGVKFVAVVCEPNPESGGIWYKGTVPVTV